MRERRGDHRCALANDAVHRYQDALKANCTHVNIVGLIEWDEVVVRKELISAVIR